MRMLKGEVHKSLLASEIEVLKTFKHAKNIIEVYDRLWKNIAKAEWPCINRIFDYKTD